MGPQLTILLGVLFVVLGIITSYTGIRLFRRLRAQNPNLRWYKQTRILSGGEYALLGIVLLINYGLTTGYFSASIAPTMVVVLAIVLVIAAIGMIFLFVNGIMAKRDARRRFMEQRAAPQPTTSAATTVQRELTPEEQARQIQKRRERRKKAAAARRRQAGRA